MYSIHHLLLCYSSHIVSIGQSPLTGWFGGQAVPFVAFWLCGFLVFFFSLKSSSSSMDLVLLLMEECKQTHKCRHSPLILQGKCHCPCSYVFG